MKRFTKITLLAVVVMMGIGILLCGISTLMGGGYRAIRQLAKSGELEYGSWPFAYLSRWSEWDSWRDRADDLDDLEDLEDLEIDAWGRTDGTSRERVQTETDGSEAVTYTYDAAAFRKLEIDIGAASVIIGEGDNPERIVVELYGCREEYFRQKEDGATLELKYDTKNQVEWDNHAEIRILLPKGMCLEELDLDAGAAEGWIAHTSLECRDAEIDVGAGNITVDGFTATGKLSIEAGAGNVVILGGTYHEVELKCSLGNIDMAGRVNGSLEADCSMGNMDLRLSGTEAEYSYNLSCAMGELNVNGESYSTFSGSYREKNANAIGTIRLDCSMGNIDLSIEE